MSNRCAFVTTAVLLVAATVAGQRPPSPVKGKPAATKAWIPPRTSDGQPDLQGFWNSDTLTPMERPSEFAGKEFFTEQEAAEFERRAALSSFDDRGAVPEWDLSGNDGNQFWYDRPATLDGRRTSLIVDPPDGRVPAFTPEAQRQMTAFLEARERAEGPESRDRGERCLGLTVIRRISQIVQAPGYVVILREAFANLPSHADVIPLNERPPLPAEIRLWDGDARGRWEGNTLVVETAHFIDEAGYYSRTFPDANPRVIERYTLTGQDTLLWEVTTESSTFTKPFTYQLHLKRTTGPLLEFACNEGNYSMTNILAGARAAEKTGATISGRVRNASGQPMLNVSVRVVRVAYHRDGYAVLRDASSISSTRTNERGEYRIFPVPPGEYYLEADAASGTQAVRTFYPGVMNFTAAAPVVTQEHAQLTGMDIEMETGTFKLRGQVNGITSPRSDAWMCIVARDTNIPDNYCGLGSARVDGATGKFEMENIPPGTYDLYAGVNDLQNWLAHGAAYALGRISIEVHDRDLDGLSIFIHPSVEVKGTVSYEERAADMTSIRVGLLAEGSSVKNWIYAELSQRPEATRPDGSFGIPGVPEGRFRVKLEGLPAGAYVADVRQGNTSVYDSGFKVGAASPSPIQVLVNSGAGNIQGIVRDGAGKPVSFATVVLAPELKHRENRALYADTTSDSDGKFTIAGIAPGAYKLFAWERTVWLGARQNPAFIVKYEELGRPVNVPNRDTVGAEVTAITVANERPR